MRRANGWHQRAAGIVALALVLGACASNDDVKTAPDTSAATNGTEATNATKTLRTPDGRVRTYRLHVPAGVAPSSGWPLLIALHGGVGSAKQFEQASGFSSLADTHRFAVAYPDGVGAGRQEDRLRTWNGGYCCGSAVRNNVDDVEFIRRVVRAVKADFTIDPNLVAAAGHSNGGIMAYRLACELSDVIVAIGVQSGSLGVDRCTPSKPVSVIHIHGTADENHPIDGGRGTNGISGVTFRSAIDGVEAFATAEHLTRAERDEASPTNPEVLITRWGPDRAGTEVELMKVTGATHAWMGPKSQSAASRRLSGAQYTRLDSSEVIWNFLAAHPRK